MTSPIEGRPRFSRLFCLACFSPYAFIIPLHIVTTIALSQAHHLIVKTLDSESICLPSLSPRIHSQYESIHRNLYVLPSLTFFIFLDGAILGSCAYSTMHLYRLTTPLLGCQSQRSIPFTPTVPQSNVSLS